MAYKGVIFMSKMFKNSYLIPKIFRGSYPRNPVIKEKKRGEEKGVERREGRGGGRVASWLLGDGRP